MADHCGGRSGDIGPDFELRCALAGRRDQQRRCPACCRKAHDQRCEQCRLATIARGQSARNRAQKNGDKRSSFYERVGGWQLFAPQMIRKNAIFYGTKKRCENAEAEQCGEQKRKRTPHIRPHRQSGYKDLHELEPLRNPCLVVAICQFASERGQKKIGRNEDRARDRDQSLGIVRTRLKQDDKDQRGLEKIIVECREELAPEQRRKSSRQQQGRWHAGALLQSSHDCAGQGPKNWSKKLVQKIGPKNWSKKL